MTKLYQVLAEMTKEKRLNAVKAGAAPAVRFEATLLGSILSDLTPVGKAKEKDDWEPADVDVLKKIKTFSDGVEESLSALSKLPGAENDKRMPQLRAESALLTALLEAHQPKQMSEDELNAEIKVLVDALPKEPAMKPGQMIGQVMRGLKAKFDGKFDGTLASTLVNKAVADLPKKAAKNS